MFDKNHILGHWGPRRTAYLIPMTAARPMATRRYTLVPAERQRGRADAALLCDDDQWDTFTEDLRLRLHDGPAGDDPVWRAVGLECTAERAQMRASADRGTPSGGAEVMLWPLNGLPLTFRVSTRWPIRALRVLVAEHFGCCLGQVRLLLDPPH